MVRRIGMVCMTVALTLGAARTASADWLLTGFVSPLFGVKTSEQVFEDFDFTLPPEEFDSSTGFGFNLASAFPNRGNLGFEIDFGYYPKALHDSSELGDFLASKMIGISTNFFYSPAVPRVRPYFSVGPTFHYRSDHDDAFFESPSGWAVGMNGGGGVIVFATQRFGGRIDLRYFRNFGQFYDLREEPEFGERATGWKDLRYFRVFIGGTVVL